MASPALKVLPGGSAGTPYNRFWDAWEWFRTEKEGDACSPKTIEYYEFRRPRQPHKQALLFDIGELRRILKCCETPTEELAMRLLVGAGLRESELCGLRVKGPDGSPNLIPDPSEPGRFLLRVLWDAGSKGKKTRFVPISAKLAAYIRRYIATGRPHETPYPELLISRRGQPFKPDGVKSMMNRFQRRLGFRVHAHAFRHTYATASVQMDVNLEKLRAAMGHADYDTLLRYVKLASERPLGSAKDWAEFIYVPARSLAG